MDRNTIRKEKIGIVTSNKMKDTIIVKVERKVKHLKYGKFVKNSSKFFVDDNNNTCSIGDKVKIVETRPLSKNKCWRLLEIIEKVK